MAYITGEATDHFNLLEILRDFLKTNTTLVGAGQEWEQVGGETGTIGHGEFVSLKGPGLGGTDQIFLSIEAYTNAPAGRYCLRARGHTAYNPAVPSTDPPGLSSPWVYLPLVNATIRYWIVASGRRFIMIAKSNNRYDVLYGGFVLPEHLPSDWSYPVLIGGSATAYMGSSNDTLAHSNFWCGAQSGYLFTPQQLWQPLDNRTTSGSSNPNAGRDQDVTEGRVMTVDWKTNIGESAFTRTLDGEPWLRHGRIAQFSNDDVNPKNFLGHFDGVFFTPAAAAVIEGIIEHDSKDYLVVSNVYRNSDGNVAAICLE